MAGKSNAKGGTRRQVNKKGKASSKTEAAFGEEIILLVILAVSILLFLGNFGLIGGNDTGGNWISNRMRGLLGITEYIFPIVFFVTVCLCLMNPGNRRIHGKVAVIYVAFFDIGAIVQALCGNHYENLFDYGMEHVFSGGLLCGSIAKLLHSFLGFLGTFVILFIILVGCIVFLTGTSLVRGVENQGRRVYENTREGARRRRDNYEVRRGERRERQQHRRQEQAEERERRRHEREEEQEIIRAKEQERRKQQLEEMRILQEKRREEEQLRRAKEAEHQRKKKEKIAKQMAYMEQDMKEREARMQQYEKKEYGSVNGREIVVLDQPKKAKKVDTSSKDMHEIVLDEDIQEDSVAGMGHAQAPMANAFTIQMGGEISEIAVSDDDMSAASEASERKPDKPIPTADSAENKEEKPMPPAPSRETAQRGSEANPSVYRKPDLSLLKRCGKEEMESKESLTNTGMKLQKTLQSFGVRVLVTNISCGPSVTRYELQPEQGVKVSKIVGLADDIKLNLAVEDIRIEAPIPGKAAVGIEVPNKKPSPVLLGDLLASEEFKKSTSPLSFAVGKDIGGNVVVHDVAKMPHLLIAGATGSGKSVCINTLIMSILYKADPEKVKLIMVDPKVVELSVYNGIPHMMIPVVTDPKKAAGALNWAVTEMTERYQKLADMGVRDIKGYNDKVARLPDTDEKPPFMPQIVIIVDELADLMMVSKSEVEDAICRLAQLARAAGIHLVIATQRPSVDVITGLIKANMPSRIALSVSSGVDSRTIIDINGAEKLLGRGDMLFYPSGYPKPVRVQGAYISDGEVSAVADALISQGQEATYDSEVQERIEQMQKVTVADSGSDKDNGSLYDDYFVEAGKFVIEKDKGSIGMLQRMFRVGFNRAARIMDQLEEAGVVGAEEGTKARRVLMSMEEFEAFVEEYV